MVGPDPFPAGNVSLRLAVTSRNGFYRTGLGVPAKLPAEGIERGL